MNASRLLNPNGPLDADVSNQLRMVRKTKSIWVKLLKVANEVETLEGRVNAQAGDFLCRGLLGEHWPQKGEKLLEKYTPSQHMDSEGWQRYDPKPDSDAAEAAQISYPFRVIARWGELAGKPCDYVLRSRTDPLDIWIVDKAIFEASYEACTDPDPINLP